MGGRREGMAAAGRARQRADLGLHARQPPMTEREAVTRLLGAIRAASPLLRHGHHSQAAAVLEDAEKAVRDGLRLNPSEGRYGEGARNA
jgi:hypothetical protein